MLRALLREDRDFRIGAGKGPDAPSGSREMAPPPQAFNGHANDRGLSDGRDGKIANAGPARVDRMQCAPAKPAGAHRYNNNTQMVFNILLMPNPLLFF
jgi:hypothetical protein